MKGYRTILLTFFTRRFGMFNRRMALASVVVCLAAVMLVGLLSQAIAAPQAEDTNSQRGPRRGQRFDPEQMQRMMAERLKETLQITDEEWTVFEPRITKVMTLSREGGNFGGMGMMMRGQRGNFGPGGQGPRGMNTQAPQQELTGVEKSMQELQTVLDNKDAKPEEIKAKLTALRDAREKARQDLVKAQKELRDIVSVRQEAQLVMMGLLN
jgi:peptidoglycan hydrolase CwlO-like protein